MIDEWGQITFAVFCFQKKKRVRQREKQSVPGRGDRKGGNTKSGAGACRAAAETETLLNLLRVDARGRFSGTTFSSELARHGGHCLRSLHRAFARGVPTAAATSPDLKAAAPSRASARAMSATPPPAAASAIPTTAHAAAAANARHSDDGTPDDDQRAALAAPLGGAGGPMQQLMEEAAILASSAEIGGTPAHRRKSDVAMLLVCCLLARLSTEAIL